MIVKRKQLRYNIIIRLHLTKEVDRISPLCSVVIPAYRCGRYIASAIRSALEQTHDNLEIIVIDDCSADDTYEVILSCSADPRVIVLRNDQNMGVAQSRNRAFAAATGEYIALLDGDDIWLPDKLKLQLERLRQTQADICCSAYSFIDADGNPLAGQFNPPDNLTLSRLLKQNFIGCSTAVFRRGLVENIQMRREYAHEDYVFWLEALRLGYRVTSVGLPLMRYRVLKGSRSANKARAAENRWAIYRRFLGMNCFQSLYHLFFYLYYGVSKHVFRL